MESCETPTTFGRPFVVVLLTAIIAASSIMLAGPQVLVMAPFALGAGLVFALKRSFWSLVCFGYPSLHRSPMPP